MRRVVLVFSVAFVAIVGLAYVMWAKEGDPYFVKFVTTKGDFVIEVQPEWAPVGAARFKELVEAKYYDECRFFRTVKGFMTQIGMNGDPQVNAQWKEKKIVDDPVVKSNRLGFVTFATSGKNSRTTQFFINYADNTFLDNMGFSPIGKVVKGLSVVNDLNHEYGEKPDQQQIGARGNAYLNEKFPNLDFVKSARIVESPDK